MKHLLTSKPTSERQEIDRLLEEEGAKIKEIAYANGKQLGLNEPPRPLAQGDNLLPYIMDIKSKCEHLAVKILHKLKPALHIPEGKLDASWADLHHKRISDEFRGIEKRLNFLEHELTGYHPEAIPKRKRKAKIFILLLYLGEIIFNGVAFQVLGDSMLVSMAIAGFITLLIAFAAHTSGRQYGEARTKAKRHLVLLLSALFASAFAAAITELRNSYLQQMGFQGSPWIFILVNLAAFLAAAFVSWHYYPTKAEDDRNKEMLQKYEEKLELEKRRAEKRKELIDHELRSKEKLSVHMNIPVEAAYAIAEVDCLFRDAITVFMNANMHCRFETPTCYNEPLPKLEIPEITFLSAINKYKSPSYENNSDHHNS